MNCIYNSLLSLKYENVFEITKEKMYLKLNKLSISSNHVENKKQKKQTIDVGFELRFKNTYEHYFENGQ